MEQIAQMLRIKSFVWHSFVTPTKILTLQLVSLLNSMNHVCLKRKQMRFFSFWWGCGCDISTYTHTRREAQTVSDSVAFAMSVASNITPISVVLFSSREPISISSMPESGYCRPYAHTPSISVQISPQADFSSIH